MILKVSDDVKLNNKKVFPRQMYGLSTKVPDNPRINVCDVISENLPYGETNIVGSGQT